MTSALKWLEISSRNNLGVFFSFCFPLPILRNPNAFLISAGETMGYSHHQGLHLVHCLAWFSEQSSEVQTAIFIVPVLWLQKLGLDDIKRFLVCFPVSGQAVVNDWEAAPGADGACLLLAASPRFHPARGRPLSKERANSRASTGTMSQGLWSWSTSPLSGTPAWNSWNVPMALSVQ